MRQVAELRPPLPITDVEKVAVALERIATAMERIATLIEKFDLGIS